jgi:hypothetical protein
MQANLTAVRVQAAIDYTAMKTSAAKLDSLAQQVTTLLATRQAPPILASVITHAANVLRDGVEHGTADQLDGHHLAVAISVALAWLETH